jgi:hypothetical protein
MVVSGVAAGMIGKGVTNCCSANGLSSVFFEEPSTTVMVLVSLPQPEKSMTEQHNRNTAINRFIFPPMGSIEQLPDTCIRQTFLNGIQTRFFSVIKFAGDCTSFSK